MQPDWQTLTAASIVTFTLLLFVFRLVRPKNKSSCGKGCGCRKP